MATYKAQADLYIPKKTAGTYPVEDDYTVWMQEGLQTVLNALPTDMLWMFENSESDVPNDGVFVGTNKVMYVQRESDTNLIDSSGNGSNDTKMLVECREVPAALRGRVTPGSGWQEEASETDPVWFKLGGKVYMFPASTSTESKVYWVKNPPEGWVGSSEYLDGTIPMEVDPLVLSYITYKALCTVSTGITTEQRDDEKDLHGSMTEINSAFEGVVDAMSESLTARTSMRTELSGCSTLATSMEEEIDNAIAEILESAGDTDSSSSGLKSAADALTSEVAKFTASTDFITNEDVELSGVSDALQKANDLISNNSPTSGTDALDWIIEEDSEMVQAVVATAQGEIGRAQAHLSQYAAGIQALTQSVQGFASDVSARSGWTQAKSLVWNGYLATSQGFAGEIQSKVAIAQGHAGDAQANIGVAGGYINEITMRLGVIESELKEYQANSQARGQIVQNITMETAKFDKQFREGLMLLAKGTYAQESTGDKKSPPTYSGMSE